MEIESLLEQRKAKDRMFASSPESPLAPDLRAGFQGLDYYPPDPGLLFVAPLDPGNLSEVLVDTSDQRHKVYRRAGLVAVHVDGLALTLAVYDTGHPGLFIPFRDTTAGIETYGAGRYLDIDPHDDGTITVDFNQAYNPYCAYGGGYSCPLPPTENWLPVPIRAGEKAFAAPANPGPTNMAEERGGAN